MSRSYQRFLRADHQPVIDEVRRTGKVIRTKENEAAFRELLDSRAILVYENAEEWYNVNPVIEEKAPEQGGDWSEGVS